MKLTSYFFAIQWSDLIKFPYTVQQAQCPTYSGGELSMISNWDICVYLSVSRNQAIFYFPNPIMKSGLPGCTAQPCRPYSVDILTFASQSVKSMPSLFHHP